MLNHMVEKAKEEQIFCREDTPTEQRVLGAFTNKRFVSHPETPFLETFLYHSGLSYRQVETVVGRSYESVRQWYQRMSHLFEVEGDHQTIAVDETKMKVEDNEVYVWAAVDVDTFEVIHVDVSEGRSSLDALLFLREVLRRCRGKPLIKTDRGPWYDWALNELDCDYQKQTFGERSLVERWFGILKHRTTLFWHRFPHNSSLQSAQNWVSSFASVYNLML